MQYIVFCRISDPADPDVQAKRAASRDEHVRRIEAFQARGAILVGGATLDEEGNPTGSAGIWEVDSLAELEEVLAEDPWSKAGVWSDFEFIPFRIAEHYEKLLSFSRNNEAGLSDHHDA